MNTPRQLDSLTGLRGVLALWVILLHIAIAMLWSHFSLEEHFSRPVADVFLSGFLAVDMFFLLSGFIMCHVYENVLVTTKNLRAAARFYALRLSRLYPVHLTGLLAYLVLKLSGVVFLVESCSHPLLPLPPIPCERFSVHGFIEHLFLVSSWGWTPDLTWNPPAWSINSEWFMYICFPVLILFIARVKNAWAALLSAALSLMLMILVLWQRDLLYAHIANDEHGLIRVTGCFICGCFLYQFFRTEAYLRLPWPWIGTTCLAIICFLLTTDDYLTAAVPLFALLLLSLAQPAGWLSRALATPVMLWLGKISYSLYMTHLLVMEVIGLIMGGPTAEPLSEMSTLKALGMISFVITASIAVAALVYYLIEEPARKQLRIVIERYLGHA